MRATAIVLGFIIVSLDLITKRWVANSGWLRHYIIIDGFFRIDYVQNEGIAFGLFHSLQSQWKPIILSGMAIVAVTIVLYYIWRTPPDQKGLFMSLGLLLGGILGNFIDRLLNHYVTDFIEVHWRDQFSWPTFNLADAAITCGVLLILYQTFVGEDDQEFQRDEQATPNGKSSV